MLVLRIQKGLDLKKMFNDNNYKEKLRKELKQLSPEERIKKLKEITEKDKKEIEIAQAMIKESIAELAAINEEKSKIPIPQLKSDDISTLFGEGTEEEMMWRTKRFIHKPIKLSEEKKETKAIEEQAALEQKIIETHPRLTREEAEELQTLYQIETPTQRIYQVVSEIYDNFKKTGELTPFQMEQLNAASYNASVKMVDIRTGKYPASSEVERELVQTIEIVEKIKKTYQS